MVNVPLTRVTAMTTSFAPRSAPRADQRKHLENARFAVSLGAAFALLCAVVFDTPESQAANGLFELLFGGGGYNGYYAQQTPTLSYGGYSGYGRSYGRHRHARRSRPHYAHARRSVAERRTDVRRAATARVVEQRHHIAANVRRSKERRDIAVNTVEKERDFIAIAMPPVRPAMTPRPAPAEVVAERKPAEVTERKTSLPIETVSFADAGATPNNASASRTAVCVRACDGFYFRIAAKASEAAAQETCERLCPGSETKAFLLPGGATTVNDAVAVGGGETYVQFVARLNPDSAKAKSCACPQTAENLTSTSAFMSDLTLRPGDTVVTPEGVKVLRRGSRYPFKRSDFLSLTETRALPRATRGALFAIDRALKTPYGRLAVASNSERRRHRANADL